MFSPSACKFVEHHTPIPSPVDVVLGGPMEKVNSDVAPSCPARSPSDKIENK